MVISRKMAYFNQQTKITTFCERQPQFCVVPNDRHRESWIFKQAVTYAENFHGGGCFIQWHILVICICVRCLWRYNLTSYSCFQTNVLAKFVYIICMFFYTHSLCFMCHWTESALQVRILEENTPNATTQQVHNCKNIRLRVKSKSEQFATAKWGCADVSSHTSRESVQLEWLTHTLVCKIEPC